MTTRKTPAPRTSDREATERSETDRETSALGRATDDSRRMETPRMDRWSPANTLELPPDDADFHYRWIREYANGVVDARNVQQALRQGFQRVPISDLSEDFQVYVDEDERGDGYARTGGLILMRIPHEFVRQRTAYFRRRSAEALHGADVLQGIAGRDRVSEDRGTRALEGADAQAALEQMSRA